jgi:dipeptidase
LWVAVTTALATAFIAFLQYRQTEHTLLQYTQTSTNLENVKAWWTALSAQEQADRKNVDKLVETTERILESEHRSWIQQMQDALAQLRGEQAKSEGGQEPGQGTPLRQG